ncbi:hypothetical protein SSTU70S_02686 [Stutzerimonas stutzeri]
MDTRLPSKPLWMFFEHFLGEVHAAVAGGFRADQAAAVGQALAGQYRGELVGQALVLAEEEADLAAADADVTGRYVENPRRCGGTARS